MERRRRRRAARAMCIVPFTLASKRSEKVCGRRDHALPARSRSSTCRGVGDRDGEVAIGPIGALASPSTVTVTMLLPGAQPASAAKQRECGDAHHRRLTPKVLGGDAASLGVVAGDGDRDHAAGDDHAADRGPQPPLLVERLVRRRRRRCVVVTRSGRRRAAAWLRRAVLLVELALPVRRALLVVELPLQPLDVAPRPRRGWAPRACGADTTCRPSARRSSPAPR